MTLQNSIRKHPEQERWENDVRKEFAIGICKNPVLEEQLRWYFNTFCLGFRPGERSANGWVRPKSRPRLMPRYVAKKLGFFGSEPTPFSISPANETCWAAIDIDESSRYHPSSEEGEGLEPVKAALATIGLRDAIEFQSSFSTGIHLWYPLCCPTNTWDLAKGMESCLPSNKLQIMNGVLEIFPNIKDYKSLYLTIRAPLSGEGNAVWVEGFGLVDDMSVFKQMYEKAANKNEFSDAYTHNTPPPDIVTNRRGAWIHKSPYCFLEIQQRLSEGFSRSGQTHDIAFCALLTARLVEGIDSPNGLRRRASEIVKRLPGFTKYCGHQQTICNGSYWSKTAISEALSFKPGGYENTWKQKANNKRHDNAKERAVRAICMALEEGLSFTSMRDAIIQLRALYGAPAASWWHKSLNKTTKGMLFELIR